MPHTVLSLYDMHASSDPTETISVRNLTTGLGLAIHDPAARVGGMVSTLLGEPENEAQAESQPLLFTSSALPMLVHSLESMGAKRQNMVVKAAGCASLITILPVFDTGRRNAVHLMERLRDMALTLAAKDLGGSATRSMSLHVGTGKVVIRRHTQEFVL